MQQNKPLKISVITPSYNQGKYLEETILSVINQKYPGLEYIIIDGGSTDNSVEIIKKYEQHIAYWVSEKDNGTYDANNKGLRVMTGEYWCVVNSDDLLLPGSLQLIADTAMKNPGEKWICGGIKYIDEASIVTGKEFPRKPINIGNYSFFNGCWISHPTVFLHKDLVKAIGHFRKYHLMDLDYWLRLENAGFFPFIIDQFLAALRIHQDCKSADTVQLYKELIKVFKNFIYENNLSAKSEIKRFLKDHQVYLNRLYFYENLVSEKKKTAFVLLLKIGIAKPNVIFENWFMGGVKRLIFKLSANDPLLQEYGVKGKANWNSLA